MSEPENQNPWPIGMNMKIRRSGWVPHACGTGRQQKGRFPRDSTSPVKETKLAMANSCIIPPNCSIRHYWLQFMYISDYWLQFISDIQ